MDKVYDLHCHSSVSDGVLLPTEVVRRAHAQGVDVLALTDHDSVSGIAEAKAEAGRLGMRLISGVEISTQWENRSVHIIGLNFDETSPKMTALLNHQAQLRLQRALEIGRKLEKAGVSDAFEGARSLAGGQVTRAHFARYLIQIGKVADAQQAFKKYLAQGKSCYVKVPWTDIASAVDIIHQSGGVAVLAHPLRYNLTAKWIRRLIADFKSRQGDGMEVAGCGQNKDQRRLLARWATEFGLAGSVGSDFHFPCGWVELGKSLCLPEEVPFILDFS